MHPTTRPYLDLLFPIPDGQDFGDGTAELAHSHQDPTDEHFGVVKFDYNLGKGGSTLMVRWSRDVSDTNISQAHPLFFEQVGTDTRYFTTQLQRIFGSGLLNTVRFAANRTGRDNDLIPTVDIPTSLYFSRRSALRGAINIANISTAGSIATIPVDYKQDLFPALRHAHLDEGRPRGQGRLRLAEVSLRRILVLALRRRVPVPQPARSSCTLNRSATAQADRFTGNLPGTDTFRQMRQHYVAIFVQDDWRVTNNLSVNYGLRYEFVTDPNGTERANRRSSEPRRSRARAVRRHRQGTPMFDNPSKKSFAPRLGAAWNPLGDKRMTVKGGYGLFYQPLTTSFYRGTTFRIYPYFAGVDIRQPTVFGPGNIAVLAGGINPALGAEAVGVHLLRRRAAVYAAVARQRRARFRAQPRRRESATSDRRATTCRSTAIRTRRRPSTAQTASSGWCRARRCAIPSWGRIRTRTNIARSNYHGMTLSLNKRFSDGWQLQASYTLGDSKDTGRADRSVAATSTTAPAARPTGSIRNTSTDRRATTSVTTSWSTASTCCRSDTTSTGVKAFFVKGWQVGGVMQFSSGLPFTPFLAYDQVGDRPERRRAAQAERERRRQLSGNGRTVVRSVGLQRAGRRACSATRRRNSLRAAGVKVADLSAFKNFTFGRYQAQFRFEAFNAFNWVNFGLPDATIFTSAGVRNPTAGRIRSTSTPARQIQLGFKFLF